MMKTDTGTESTRQEKNRICFTCISGHNIEEFGRLKSVRPVKLSHSDKYTYIILFDNDHVSLYNDGDWVEYGGIRYDFRDGGLNRLWMMLENENNLAALEAL